MMKDILNGKTEWNKYWDKNGNFKLFDLATKKNKNIYIHGRNDDVVNVRGHRIGSEEIESTLLKIRKIKRKNMKFHARFSAKERIYKYVIFNQLSKPILQNKRGWFVIKNLELEMMKKAAKKLIGTQDFSTFRASGCNAKSPIRSIKSVKIKKTKNKFELEFRSQSFLKQQVRSMVGCLKYIGEKKWTLKKFTSVIKLKNRNLCAPPAPAEGLFLKKVLY